MSDKLWLVVMLRQTKGSSGQVGFRAREAAGGMKPGVERSETPGAGVENKKVRGAAGSRIIVIGILNRAAIGRSAGSEALV